MNLNKKTNKMKSTLVATVAGVATVANANDQYGSSSFQQDHGHGDSFLGGLGLGLGLNGSSNFGSLST